MYLHVLVVFKGMLARNSIESSKILSETAYLLRIHWPIVFGSGSKNSTNLSSVTLGNRKMTFPEQDFRVHKMSGCQEFLKTKPCC